MTVRLFFRRDAWTGGARLVATLALAWAAARACEALGTPLPWMIGPLMATAVAALAGLPVRSAPLLRNVGQWTIGTALGLVAGYKGGWWDTIISRCMDALLAFPSILLALVVIVALGTSIENVMIAVGVATVPQYARIVRGSVLAIKQLPLVVQACRPIAEAISSAGGVLFEVLTPRLMLEQIPGVFCAGEMLDWEAPTGGYLLQAGFATAVAAAHGIIGFLGHDEGSSPDQ